MPEPIDILHVDDEPELAEMVGDFLERKNDHFTVETATSAKDGLGKLTEKSFDCIVSDYDMPSQDGIEFLNTVREEHSELPFILYTGKGSEAVASEAISAGVTDYLQKESGTSQYALLANRIENAVEQRRTQQQRQRSERRFNAMFEDPQMLVGILDPDGTLRKANQTAMEYIDADHDAVTGEFFWDTPWWSDEVRSDVQEWIARAADGEYVDYTADLTRSSGSQYSVEGTIRPVTTNGDIVSLIVSARDVTKRRERERELEVRSSAMEASIDGMALLDADESYTFVNQAHADIYGYDDPDTFLGESWRMCYSAAEQERLEEDVLPELRDRGNWRGEAIGQRQDGTTFPQKLSLTVLDNGNIVCVVRDITERKEQQQALEETKQQYETIAEESRDGIRIVQDGTVVFANKRLAELLDTSKAEIIGNPCDEMVIPEQKHLVRTRHTARMGDDSPPRQYEVQLDTAQDETKYVELSVNRIQYQGEPASLSIIRDITDRKQREEELERYKAYLEQSAEAITVLDTNGRIQYESPEIETILGYDPTERVGELAFDYVHPDDRAALTELFERSITESGVIEAELRSRHTNGSWRWLESRATFHPDPPIEGVIASSRDITDRKQRERELTRYEETLDALPDSVSLFDSNLDCIYVNQTLVDESGIPDDEYLEKPIETVLDPFSDAEAHEWIQMMERLVAGEQAHAQQILSIPTDTGIRYLDTTAGRIESEAGELLGIVNVLRDVTERVETQRTIQRQNEHLENFASFVGHDLRNPLNVAEGHLDLARTECDNEHLETVADAHDRMATLIEDLLMLARQGTTIEEVESVDLALLAETCWKTVETAAASLNVTAEQTIRADENRVQELLENLFRNAVEHAGADVIVTVGDLADGQGFYVADDGPGIPEDERDKVFDAGYSTTDNGTGLGLKIVQEIADAHGWDITVTESDAGGVRFTITGVEVIDP